MWASEVNCGYFERNSLIFSFLYHRNSLISVPFISISFLYHTNPLNCKIKTITMYTPLKSSDTIKNHAKTPTADRLRSMDHCRDNFPSTISSLPLLKHHIPDTTVHCSFALRIFAKFIHLAWYSHIHIIEASTHLLSSIYGINIRYYAWKHLINMYEKVQLFWSSSEIIISKQ